MISSSAIPHFVVDHPPTSAGRSPAIAQNTAAQVIITAPIILFFIIFLRPKLTEDFTNIRGLRRTFTPDYRWGVRRMGLLLVNPEI